MTWRKLNFPLVATAEVKCHYDMSLLLKRTHTSTHACTRTHTGTAHSLALTQVTVNTLRALATTTTPPTPPPPALPESALLGCVVMLPSPKPFIRSKELKPALRKRMGK